MISVIVRFVADLNAEDGTQRRKCFAAVEANSYTPETLDKLIPELLEQAMTNLAVSQPCDLKKANPEVGICITSDEGQRAAFNISADTVALLCMAGTGIDFDPYMSDTANPGSDKPPSWD